MTADLPDTPAWSPRRVAAVRALFLAGALMVAAGCLPTLTDSRAMLLIASGTDAMLAAVGLFVGAATVERGAAWWPRRQPLAGDWSGLGAAPMPPPGGGMGLYGGGYAAMGDPSPPWPRPPGGGP
jgi:hypothetical protein